MDAAMSWVPPEARPGFNPYLGYVSAGFCFFVALNAVVQRWLTPFPDTASRKQKWKWCNIFVSFVHSTLTGVCSPLVFYFSPEAREDMVNGYSDFAHALVSFSIGYFIYDFIDMALYNMKKSTYELLFHHACVITCFGIAAHTKHFLPYSALALMIEINSVFLHARGLLIIKEVPKQTMTYRNVALLNVATFVLFRILLLGWMTRWITVNRLRLDLLFFLTGSIGLFIIQTMNAFLFYKILKADFFQVSRPSNMSKSEECETNILNENFHPVSKDVNKIMHHFFSGEDASAPTKAKAD